MAKPYEFSYFGHSNCCLGSGTGFVCRNRTGKGKDLLEVEYDPAIGGVDKADMEAVVRALQQPDLMFRWNRRTLRLKRTRVALVSRDSGESHEGDMTVPMVNRFDCGGRDPK